MKILSLFAVLVIGLADVSAVGPKVYDPPKVCECVKCVCEDCNCSNEESKTKENKVKVKYLTYSEGQKVIENNNNISLITFVGIEPTEDAYGENKCVCYAKALDGYKKGDVIVSKIINGKHLQISLNNSSERVIVSYEKRCDGKTCVWVPVYSK